MALALVMHRALFGRGLIRTSVLIPYGIVTVVAAFAWFFAFDPSSGFVNSLPFIADDKAWFGDRGSAFTVIILTEVWKTTPFMALLLLAGLATIDEGLYEAAKVDGASAGSASSGSRCRCSSRRCSSRCCSARSTPSACSTRSSS